MKNENVKKKTCKFSSREIRRLFAGVSHFDWGGPISKRTKQKQTANKRNETVFACFKRATTSERSGLSSVFQKNNINFFTVIACSFSSLDFFFASVLLSLSISFFFYLLEFREKSILHDFLHL